MLYNNIYQNSNNFSSQKNSETNFNYTSSPKAKSSANNSYTEQTSNNNRYNTYKHNAYNDFVKEIINSFSFKQNINNKKNDRFKLFIIVSIIILIVTIPGFRALLFNDFYTFILLISIIVGIILFL